MLDKPHKLESLPKWAQAYIHTLNCEVKHLNALKEMHAVLSDKNRDWFTLTDPCNGCNQELLHLWILNADQPISVCSLSKGDLLFVGRKPKEGK